MANQFNKIMMSMFGLKQTKLRDYHHFINDCFLIYIQCFPFFS